LSSLRPNVTQALEHTTDFVFASVGLLGRLHGEPCNCGSVLAASAALRNSNPLAFKPGHAMGN
jgi:hypothetical protein